MLNQPTSQQKSPDLITLPGEVKTSLLPWQRQQPPQPPRPVWQRPPPFGSVGIGIGMKNPDIEQNDQVFMIKNSCLPEVFT